MKHKTQILYCININIFWVLMRGHGLNSDRRFHVTLSTLQFDDFFNYNVQNPLMVLVSPIQEIFGLVS